MVGLGRLELPTSRLSGVRSNRAELQAPEASKALARSINPDHANTRSRALDWRKRNEGGDIPLCFVETAIQSKTIDIQSLVLQRSDNRQSED